MFRGFIAVDIDKNPKIYNILEELDKTGANLKIVKPEKIHITLKFLGDTDEAKTEDIETVIKEVVKETKPFKIKLEDLGVFPNENYIKVIWIGIKNSEKLKKIAEEIDQKLTQHGFKKNKRGFSAHLTIARVKSAKNKKQIQDLLKKYKGEVFGEANIDSVKLMKSELTPKGPIYTVKKEIKI